MTQVKICGVNDPASFDAAIAAGANWIGFVFFTASPRFVTPSAAAGLSARHAGGALRVGLFVAPSDAQIAEAIGQVSLDVLQLYDTAARIDEVAARFGLPVWRSVALAAPGDLPSNAGSAAALLIEPRPPAGASRPGGNATTLDWAMLNGWKPGFRWLLAGGLTPANVVAAIATSGAEAVDVSSGVEIAPGRKSPDLIGAFVAAARGAMPKARAVDPSALRSKRESPAFLKYR